MTLSTRIPSSCRHWSSLPVASLQGGVHRFIAVVDHLDPGSPDGTPPISLRLRDVRRADSRQPLACDPLDLPLGEVWLQAGVQEGDTVLFTAKVPRCPPSPSRVKRGEAAANPVRCQPMATLLPRGAVVLRRRQTSGHRLRALQSETRQLQQQLEQLEADSERLQQHCDVLHGDNDSLRQALACQTTGIEAERRSRQQLQRAICGLKRRLLGTALLALLAGGGLGLGLAPHPGPATGDGMSQRSDTPRHR